MLSRNFRLQRVGDLQWLNKNYNFKNIAFVIDELLILDVSEKERDIKLFSQHVQELGDQCFVPIAAGGGIRNISDAKRLLDSGADKVVVNTTLHTDPSMVAELISIYGSQCIIGSIDLKNQGDSFQVMINNGNDGLQIPAHSYIKSVLEQNIGELYLNSVGKDGTGQGYLFEMLALVEEKNYIPIILAGGAGNQLHLHEAIMKNNVDAVATANLFNFVGNGLPLARKFLIDSGVPLAQWVDVDDHYIKDHFLE
jgi:imidazole glycerol-phosphate synthase subunit HisF